MCAKSTCCNYYKMQMCITYTATYATYVHVASYDSTFDFQKKSWLLHMEGGI